MGTSHLFLLPLAGCKGELNENMLNSLKAQAQSGYEAVQGRLEAAKGGKKLLDEGGKEAEDIVLAKQTACDAVQSDEEIIKRISAAIAIFKDAAVKLREAIKLPPVEGIGGYEDFECLAASYEARAQTYKEILDMLQTPPEAPEMSAQEKDAATILKMRGTYQWSMTKTQEGF